MPVTRMLALALLKCCHGGQLKAWSPAQVPCGVTEVAPVSYFTRPIEDSKIILHERFFGRPPVASRPFYCIRREPHWKIIVGQPADHVSFRFIHPFSYQVYIWLDISSVWPELRLSNQISMAFQCDFFRICFFAFFFLFFIDCEKRANAFLLHEGNEGEVEARDPQEKTEDLAIHHAPMTVAGLALALAQMILKPKRVNVQGKC